MMTLTALLILLAIGLVTLAYPIAIAWRVRGRAQPRAVAPPALKARSALVIGLYALAGLHVLAGIAIASAPWKHGTVLPALIPTLTLALFYVACAHVGTLASFIGRRHSARAAR